MTSNHKSSEHNNENLSFINLKVPNLPGGVSIGSDKDNAGYSSV